MKTLAYIPPDDIKKYAMARKLPPMEAYRELFSQKLLDRLNEGATDEVVRELIYLAVGPGKQSTIQLATELPVDDGA